MVEAVLPLAALFVVLQLRFLKLPRSYVSGILKGTVLASCGLLLFLQGVNIGFLPFGRAIGEALGTMPQKWLLIPFGLLLGFLTTWGEPSVRVLADQVEEASSGSIRQTAVLYAICAGVSLFVGIGMLRIGYGIPLLYILIPGYALVVAVMKFSDKEFLAIAVDAGGVATGPMANTFLLALALGISSSMGDQDPVVHGLGLVALIALAPIISVMVLGFIFRFPKRRKE
ncbi:MAG TPA: DUF1538 domain-containing protein [Syntrophales bacterium]|nr:DUF1538 domain-containing protein [Syntrophales bacterium]HOX95343.1 DUF1538 domain-containing protein [Syntrophales bacterium]HPN25970.1 DUF1538 domain-containing protein [Syntrophales bacterium]